MNIPNLIDPTFFKAGFLPRGKRMRIAKKRNCFRRRHSHYVTPDAGEEFRLAFIILIPCSWFGG